MNIFTTNKNYLIQEIIDICNEHGLVTVDCLKDENMISVEEYNNGEFGDCIYEFHRVNEDIFKLTYSDEFLLSSALKL